eukprot:244982-Pleurochrysis_carterae.AAC.2
MEPAVDQHYVTPCAAPMQEERVARVASTFGHTGPQSAASLPASAQQLRGRHPSLLDPEGASAKRCSKPCCLGIHSLIPDWGFQRAAFTANKYVGAMR